MNPNPTDSGPIDPGTPIEILKDLQSDTSARFVEKVRGRIYRRTTASQLTTYSWHMPKSTLLEMIRLFAHLLQSFGTKKEP